MAGGLVIGWKLKIWDCNYGFSSEGVFERNFGLKKVMVISLRAVWL